MCEPVSLAFLTAPVAAWALDKDRTGSKSQPSEPDPLPDLQFQQEHAPDLDDLLAQLDQQQQNELLAQLQGQQSTDLLSQTPDVNPEFTASTSQPTGGTPTTTTAVDVPDWDALDTEIDSLDDVSTSRPPREDPPPETHRTTASSSTTDQATGRATIPREDPPPAEHRTPQSSATATDKSASSTDRVVRENPPPEAHR